MTTDIFMNQRDISIKLLLMETWNATIKLKISIIRKFSFFYRAFKDYDQEWHQEIKRQGFPLQGPSTTQAAVGKTEMGAVLKMPNRPLWLCLSHSTPSTFSQISHVGKKSLFNLHSQNTKGRLRVRWGVASKQQQLLWRLQIYNERSMPGSIIVELSSSREP